MSNSQDSSQTQQPITPATTPATIPVKPNPHYRRENFTKNHDKKSEGLKRNTDNKG
ncbi:hypothetical protein [Metabacillus hrfriensis]|uniref:Uncharacterized protein n=1 Tax=Metabacillus hrfriensis TaxID=3048891 RepID=A0ACD4RIC8_9BACI|nr:hypothetical protein [Metabacillus sp. CT-WN-B3]WHZ60084.1 hypothetical protein QLQ22_12445 [Metabacillus sp. CT-WN-B3]